MLSPLHISKFRAATIFDHMTIVYHYLYISCDGLNRIDSSTIEFIYFCMVNLKEHIAIYLLLSSTCNGSKLATIYVATGIVTLRDCRVWTIGT